ncbi:F-box protein At5g49610-like [Miscanthus floridulus]|uniref:F-box protein At5g49610-like n=1 Tax=Miscanthus floridulus TaxID=154761 RepID=UPI0034575C31
MPTTMDHGAGAGKAEATTTSLQHLNDDMVAEILLRLPSASVFRCRAVCRAWRGITSSPGFVAAYARRRPLELIVSGYSFASCVDGGLLLLERFMHGDVSLYLVCNPVSRQCVIVPLHSKRMTRPCALYVHRPSGEHRLLLLTNDDECYGWGKWASHYVRSLEAAETRRLQGPAVTGIYMCDRMVIHSLEHRGRLHWLDDHPEAKATGTVLVFDTVSETFRRMARPPPLRNGNGNDHGEIEGGGELSLCLLEMDGMLAVAAILGGSMDVWVLQDYDNDETWAHRHRVDCLPPPFVQTRWVINANTGQHKNNNNDVIIVLQDSSGSWVGLYDLSNKRLLKQIQVISDPREDGQIFFCHTHLNALLFRDTIQRHSFFDLRKSIFQFPDSDYSNFLKSLICNL